MATIIKDDGTQLYVPDRKLADGRLKIETVLNNAITLEEYNKQQDIINLTMQIADIEAMYMDVDSLVQYARENCPCFDELEQLKLELASLGG